MNVLTYRGLFPRPVHPTLWLPFEAETYEAVTPGPGTVYPFPLTKAAAIWAFWRVRHWKITVELAAGSGTDGSSISISWPAATATAHTGDTANASRSQNPTARRPLDLLSSPPAGSAHEILHSTSLEFSTTVEVTETFLGVDPPDPVVSTGTVSGNIIPGPRGLEPGAYQWLGTASDPLRYHPQISLALTVGLGSVSPITLTAGSHATGDELGTWVWELPTGPIDTPLYGTASGLAVPTFTTITMEAQEEWTYSV